VVKTGYTIKDVVVRSGFSAPTLRYYEEIGLLPESARTRAGYRLYDDQTLDRLAFIARAKQLGCSLDEIADLTTAWEGGRCGPVQDRLRTLVADKLTGAHAQIVALMTLTADLRRAATALEQHRPDGACDDSCGCVIEPVVSDPAASRQAVQLIAKPIAADGSLPIACTLGAESMEDRLDDWRAVLAHVECREPIDGGVRASFDRTAPLEALLRLTAAEQDCCQFFDFAITVDGRGIALEVRAPDDALPIVYSLFGAPG
jgi:MerR family transcriptional regulator, copper efflux regulator